MKKLKYLSLGWLILASLTSFGLPKGANVIHGDVTVSKPSANKMHISQKTPKAIIDWKDFSISKRKSVKITQPDSTSVLLNRVVGKLPSRLDGSLKANGNVFLINESGIMVGKDFQVDVHGLLLSTKDIRNKDFLSNLYKFNGNSKAVISNKAKLAPGWAVIIGDDIQNEGVIAAKMDKVFFGGGENVVVDLDGDNILSYSLGRKKSGNKFNFSNTGVLEAQNGVVIATQESMVDGLVNIEGRVDVVKKDKGGNIHIFAKNNTVKLDAKLTAKSGKIKGKGGDVKVRGKKIDIGEKSKVDVSGKKGGGNIEIGLPAKSGKGQAEEVYVAKGAEFRADATKKGDGGEITFSAEKLLDWKGKIFARGTKGKTGGRAKILTSGHFKRIKGSFAYLKAPNGRDGMLTIDPQKIFIGDPADGYEIPPGELFISPSEIQQWLINSNVEIVTLNAGAGSGDIIVKGQLTMKGSNDLWLIANRHIDFEAPGRITLAPANSGNLFLRADKNATGTGTIKFQASGTTKQIINNGSGEVSLYYNPASFGTPNPSFGDHISGAWDGYMLVNSVAKWEEISTHGGWQGFNFALGKDLGTGLGDAVTVSHVGSAVNRFTGKIDGLDHFMWINLANEIGVFGIAGKTVEIKNLELKGELFSPLGGGCGALIAVMRLNGNTCRITKVKSSVNVFGPNVAEVGGLVGRILINHTDETDPLGGKVIFSSSETTGDIQGRIHVGGLVGQLDFNNDSPGEAHFIQNLSGDSARVVKQTSAAGAGAGLVGEVKMGGTLIIKQNKVKGTIRSTVAVVGGLIGDFTYKAGCTIKISNNVVNAYMDRVNLPFDPAFDLSNGGMLIGVWNAPYSLFDLSLNEFTENYWGVLHANDPEIHVSAVGVVKAAHNTAANTVYSGARVVPSFNPRINANGDIAFMLLSPEEMASLPNGNVFKNFDFNNVWTQGDTCPNLRSVQQGFRGLVRRLMPVENVFSTDLEDLDDDYLPWAVTEDEARRHN